MKNGLDTILAGRWCVNFFQHKGGNIRKNLKRIVGVLTLVVMASPISVLGYEPPIGIPEPVWGSLNPIDAVAPDQPASWPSAETTGCYYIDNSVTCSDSNTYGYPSNPRCSIPSTFAAGSYVELHGGPYLDSWTMRAFN